MKDGYTHIHILLDRTGSMQQIRDDTIGGFNSFLKEQKEAPGEATLTLVQFDTQNPYEVVHSFKGIQEVPDLTQETFVPRAMTPLLDAIGRGVNGLGQRIGDMVEDDKPERVVLVIITDGAENSSREFRKDQVAKMVGDRQEKDKWQFVFLGADMDGIGDAGAMGISAQSTMSYDKTSQGVHDVYHSASAQVRIFRTTGQHVNFSDEDRKKQNSESAR